MNSALELKIYDSFSGLVRQHLAGTWEDSPNSLYYFGACKESAERFASTAKALEVPEKDGRVFWRLNPEVICTSPSGAERLDRFIEKVAEMGLVLPKSWREIHPDAFWSLPEFRDLLGVKRIQF
jgi:hypothetical protein